MTKTPPTGPEPIAVAPKAGGGWLSFAIDFGPLLIFFLTFKLSSGGEGNFAATAAAIQATVAFMVAISVAMLVSKWKLGKISPMLWISGILVLGFGAMTIYFHDEGFIVLKPTIIYVAFAALLLGGWMLGKPMLKFLLQSALDGVTERGWMKLSRNWGLFFAALAVANTVMYVMWRGGSLSFDAWLTIKVWGITAVSFAFALSQLPVMMKNGLSVKEASTDDSGQA